MTLHAFPFAVVIPGAGLGTRFGEPKAGALLPGTSTRFVDAVAVTAQLTGASAVLAVLPPNLLAPNGVRVVVNAKGDDEQIRSVRMGLMQLTNLPVVGALLWPVDHPFVTLESALAVIDGAKRTGAPIVVPTFEGARGHPVWFHRDTWRELMTVPEGGARAVVRIDPSRVLAVAVRDRGVLRDIDTRDALTE
ncbi:MAG: nucleotidyltransferase family protein [Gemmatimonadaceae bacterium]|nr:nucleotidyltransferase family protein [Gemmatimonadaceae bacterium]